MGAAIVSLAAASQGTVLGFSAAVIPQFQNESNPELQMTLDQAAWIRKLGRKHMRSEFSETFFLF